MKHLDRRTLETEIERLAAVAGLRLQAPQVRDLAIHLALVLEANKSFNLTAIREPGDAVRLHVIDSLTVLPEIAASPPGALADIGSGAGFPGVPLAIATGRPVVLVESVGKKARFLEEIGVALSPRHTISARKARAEDFGREQPDSFAVVIARAVSALPSLVELAAPMLEERGVFLAMKGPVSPEELSTGDAAAEIVGLQRISKRDFCLPEGGECRCVVAYTKVGGSRVAIPREVGYAQHKPLA